MGRGRHQGEVLLMRFGAVGPSSMQPQGYARAPGRSVWTVEGGLVAGAGTGKERSRPRKMVRDEGGWARGEGMARHARPRRRIERAAFEVRGSKFLNP